MKPFFKPAIAIAILMQLGAAHANSDEDVFKKALNYTVQIKTAVSIPFDGDRKGSSRGAGFVVDVQRGWIMTNAHVVSRSPARVEVAFNDRDFVPARKVYVDPYLDMAIISVGAEISHAMAIPPNLDCTSLPAVGHPVGAFGHPNNLRFTGTRGIISGHTAKIESEMLQTDAPINPGNSGGPLISLTSGRIVGMNTATQRGSQNSNFALPMPYACRVLELLREGKDPSPPDLPIAFFKDANERRQLKVARSMLAPGKLDLHQGDEIIGVVGSAEPAEAIENETQLFHALRGRLDNVALQIKRDGKEVVVRGSLAPAANPENRRGILASGVLFGDISKLFEQDEIKLGKIGIQFVDDGSLGEFNEIGQDILESVNGQIIDTLDKLYVVLDAAQKQKKPVTLILKHIGGDRTLFTYLERQLPVENIIWVRNDNGAI